MTLCRRGEDRLSTKKRRIKKIEQGLKGRGCTCPAVINIPPIDGEAFDPDLAAYPWPHCPVHGTSGPGWDKPIKVYCFPVDVWESL